MLHSIKLETEEVNAILQVLGDLPTKTNAYPLLMKIKQQAEDDIKAGEAEEVVND